MSAPPTPRQVLAIGRNYAAHAAELGNAAPDAAPLLFWKPVGCLLPPGAPCALPRWSEGPTRQDFEGEVALVLDRDLGPGTPALPDDPWDAVRGVAAGLDFSDRDLQKLEPQWVRAKGFAGACALGPEAPRPADPDGLRVRTWVGEELRQDGETHLLLFPFRPLLRYLHGFLRLFPGDAILTGTPAGVGPLAAGDVVRVVVSAGEDVLSELIVPIADGPEVAAFRR